MGVIIDSSIVGLRKPQGAIYELAEKESTVKAENILFIENSIEHTDAAKKRGWQTLLYDPSDTSSSNKELLAKLN